MSRGDRDADFTAFVAAHRTHLHRVGYAICGDWHRAEDLVQTALARLYVAWPRLHRAGREVAYARTVMVRANVDEHRRPWRREVPGLEGHDPVAREPLPVEERSALLDALDALPRTQRTVVVLRYWLGLSIEETARELGMPVGTVKSHASRGLTALEAALDEP